MCQEWSLLPAATELAGCGVVYVDGEMCNALKALLEGKITQQAASLRQGPLEAILVLFGRSFLNFFYLKGLGNIWKMTPLSCEYAVVVTRRRKTCRKKAPRFVKLSF